VVFERLADEALQGSRALAERRVIYRCGHPDISAGARRGLRELLPQYRRFCKSMSIAGDFDLPFYLTVDLVSSSDEHVFRNDFAPFVPRERSGYAV
jgi:hypothetical protein